VSFIELTLKLNEIYNDEQNEAFTTRIYRDVFNVWALKLLIKPNMKFYIKSYL
jgi:hypothetical protein